MMRTSMTFGALFRRQVRVLLDEWEIPYREHKGLLDSIFVADVTPAEFEILNRMAKHMAKARRREA